MKLAPQSLMSKTPQFFLRRNAFYEIAKSKDHLPISKAIIKTYGLDLAVFIGNLFDKFEYGGFFLTHADQTGQIGLSDYQLRKCKQKCRELGILTTKMVGIPPKEFYFLDLDALASLDKINLKGGK